MRPDGTRSRSCWPIPAPRAGLQSNTHTGHVQRNVARKIHTDSVTAPELWLIGGGFGAVLRWNPANEGYRSLHQDRDGVKIGKANDILPSSGRRRDIRKDC